MSYEGVFDDWHFEYPFCSVRHPTVRYAKGFRSSVGRRIEGQGVLELATYNANKAGGRILLVEDDNDHAALAELALSQGDIDVDLVRVSNGQEAIAYLLQEAPFTDAVRPDLVLLDLHMPRMDGHEVLRTIRSNPGLSALSVVILTTSESYADIQLAYDHAVNGYLVKPVEFDRFNQMANDIKRFWIGWNRAARI